MQVAPRFNFKSFTKDILYLKAQWLYYGRDGPGFQSGKARIFSIFKNVQSGSVPHTAYYSKDSGVIPWGWNGPDMMLITDIHRGLGEERMEI
jgi:hypothetical protein